MTSDWLVSWLYGCFVRSIRLPAMDAFRFHLETTTVYVYWTIEAEEEEEEEGEEKK